MPEVLKVEDTNRDEVEDCILQAGLRVVNELVDQTERGTSLLKNELDGRRDLVRTLTQLSSALIAFVAALSFQRDATSEALIVCLVSSLCTLLLSLACSWRSLEIYSAGFLVAASGGAMFKVLDSAWRCCQDGRFNAEELLRPIIEPIISKQSRISKASFLLLKVAMVFYAIALLSLCIALLQRG